MMRLSQMSCEEHDLLVYVLAGTAPSTRPVDMACATKGDAIRSMYESKLKKQPQRLRVLSDELDNLVVVAVRMGYSFQWLTPQSKQSVRLQNANGGLQSLALESGPQNRGADAEASHSKDPPPMQTNKRPRVCAIMPPLVAAAAKPLALADRVAPDVSDVPEDGAGREELSEAEKQLALKMVSRSEKMIRAARHSHN